MRKFQYKFIKLDKKLVTTEAKLILSIEEQLNDLGEEGWELVTFQGRFAVFKRETME